MSLPKTQTKIGSLKLHMAIDIAHIHSFKNN